MSERSPWLRFAVREGVVVDVVFSEKPSPDDLAALREMLTIQEQVLSRAARQPEPQDGRETRDAD